MLALLGLTTILVLLAAIISKKLSPMIALIAVPTTGALIGGFGLETGTFIVKGIQNIAPLAGMVLFAILYFGVMTDAGMLDPIINRILHNVGSKPTRIVMGTALLALLVHLDGSGATTFLVTIPAMLPLYDRLGMDRRVLACASAMSAGVNFMPWQGTVIRAAGALHVSTAQLFRPMIPVEIAGLIFVFTMAYLLGKREEKRLGWTGANTNQFFDRELTEHQKALRRPKNFWANIFITLMLFGIMISGIVDPVVMFMLGTVFALVINYPQVDMQRERVDAHAKAAVMVTGILLAAGAFTGILSGSGMLTAMARAAVTHLPPSMAGHIPFILGLTSMPLSLLFDPDSFYFGALPVVAEIANRVGIPPVQVGQAAILGQMTVGFPISPLTGATFVLVGLAGVELGEHQKFSIPYLFAASVVMTVVAVAFKIFPL